MRSAGREPERMAATRAPCKREGEAGTLSWRVLAAATGWARSVSTGLVRACTVHRPDEVCAKFHALQTADAAEEWGRPMRLTRSPHPAAQAVGELYRLLTAVFSLLIPYLTGHDGDALEPGATGLGGGARLTTLSGRLSTKPLARDVEDTRIRGVARAIASTRDR